MSFAHRPDEGVRGYLVVSSRRILASISAVFDRQPAHTYRQLETSWPGASGIEVEYAVFPFLLGHVAVSVDDGREFRRFRFQVEFLKIVQHVDGYFADLKNIRGRNFLCPCAVINVAAHGGQWRNRGQLVENLRIADVPGMNDVIGSLQCGESFRTQQAMSVGDHADDHWPILMEDGPLASPATPGLHF